MRDKWIVMLGIHPKSREKGGISTVVDTYRATGLFERWPVRYIGTMVSGSRVAKISVAVSAFFDFARLLLVGRVAVVHAHTASRASFWRKSIFILPALAMRVPVILHLHGAEFEQFYRNECGAFAKAFARGVLNRVDRVIALSAQWRTVIKSIAPRAHVVTIANPVPIPTRPTVAAREANLLLFLGRFGRRKGIFDLLQALTLVRQRFPDVRLRCGGDGDVAGVIARVRELGLEQHVEILGWVSGAAKERELMRATIYVLPSYAEGLPMGVLEAMAAGVPTIATRVGGIPDAIDDGVHGLLVLPGDIDALAERIMQLLDDAALRARLGAQARERAAAMFGTERVVAQIDDLYRSFGIESADGTPFKGVGVGTTNGAQSSTQRQSKNATRSTVP